MIQYSVGEIITADLPLVNVLNDDKKSTYCEYCFFKNDSLKRCTICKHIYYCDKLCQKKDWKKHKYECEIYKENYDCLKNNLDRFLLRLYLFLTNNQDFIQKEVYFLSNQNRSFEKLMTHENDIKNDKIRIKHFYTIHQRLINCNINCDKELLFEFFCKIVINSYSILNTDLNEIGSGLYIAESAFDHSCIPNAAPIFNGTYLEIRAIKEIRSGDKITINYVDLKEPKTIRQKMLQEQYYFQCNCNRCNGNFDQEFDYSYLKELITEMDEYITNENKWLQAFEIGLKTIELMDQVYNCVHPDLTLQLVRLVKLRMLICEDLDNEGIQLINRTAKLINITHGTNHDLYKVYRNIINLNSNE